MVQHIPLIERNNSGLYVELVWLGDNKIALRVKPPNEDEMIVKIDPQNAMDAFNHPYPYIYKAKDNEKTTDLVDRINEYGAKDENT